MCAGGAGDGPLEPWPCISNGDGPRSTPCCAALLNELAEFCLELCFGGVLDTSRIISGCFAVV